VTAKIVTVALGDRTYDIHIAPDVIRTARDRLYEVIGGGQAAIVADAAVWALHGERVAELLPDTPVIEVTGGEPAKSFAEYERVMDALLAAGLGRDGTVIAFGGGVVGDLAGFCAATLKRGCRLVQIPTTLLSQVDSSVGGKTAINSRHGKNLVGAFYQPALVLMDTDMLATLPPRQWRAGYAEVVKYALIGDVSFFDWLETHGRDVLAGEPGAVARAVATSCRAKADLVARDEREHGARALLNLGHTFGHALEAETGFGDRLLHGEAVAAGMGLAFRFSVSEGLCPPGDAERAQNHLRTHGLPTRIADIPHLATTAERLLDHMRQDKKVEAGRLTLILARAIGEAFTAKDVAPHRIEAFLQTELENGST
jgi:3-dehydroquinate synthase